MYVKLSRIKSYNWSSSKPILRYVVGTCFILMTVTLMDYPLSYLTSVLSLSFIAPGTRPMKFKQATVFIISLSLITSIIYFLSDYLKDYPLVFMPLLCLAILWIYYSGLPLLIKLFALISVLIIPLMSLEASGVGSFIAVSLVFNTLMAVALTQLMFICFPWSDADKVFEKEKKTQDKISELQQFKYALNILFVLLPLLLLFYIFQLSGGVLILIFAAILSISPQLSNPKTGVVMILANIFGGVMAIICYQLLTIVPLFIFMIMLVFMVGLFFGSNLFSSKKTASIYGTAFSTFLLILCSVTSSDDEAGIKVWDRVLQISMAVIYVVVAFRVLNYFINSKKSLAK